MPASVVSTHCISAGRMPLASSITGEESENRGAGSFSTSSAGFSQPIEQPGDIDSAQSMTVAGVDFLIEKGRINYDHFVVMFSDKFDLKFYGSVGFDDTLDLVVSLPIRAALLERFGVRGPVLDYARLLAGTRIDVPVIGTRLEPALDLSKVDLQPLVQRVLGDILQEKTQEVLEDILKPRKGKPPDGTSGTKKKPSKPKSGERDVLDVIIDIMESQRGSSDRHQNNSR